MNIKKNNNESFSEVLVDVNRVTKVVKGGRKFSFSACMVVGDKEGRVGYGHGKAKEVVEARGKATQEAKRKLIKVALYNNRTIFHDIVGRSGAAKVILRKAPAGTGVIAGGPMRAIFDSLGVQDIVAKSLGSNNVYAMISATFDALRRLSSPKDIAKRRNKDIGSISTKPVSDSKIIATNNA